jgi:hypothetical protein
VALAAAQRSGAMRFFNAEYRRRREAPSVEFDEEGQRRRDEEFSASVPPLIVVAPV